MCICVSFAATATVWCSVEIWFQNTNFCWPPVAHSYCLLTGNPTVSWVLQIQCTSKGRKKCDSRVLIHFTHIQYKWFITWTFWMLPKLKCIYTWVDLCWCFCIETLQCAYLQCTHMGTSSFSWYSLISPIMSSMESKDEGTSWSGQFI